MPDMQGIDGRQRVDVPPRTQPLPPADIDLAMHERERAGEALRDPVAAMREPDNRSRLWLATAALTLLNTLLLLGVLAAEVNDNGPEPVIVDGQPCLVVEGDEAGTLFCQR